MPPSLPMASEMASAAAAAAAEAAGFPGSPSPPSGDAKLPAMLPGEKIWPSGVVRAGSMLPSPGASLGGGLFADEKKKPFPLPLAEDKERGPLPPLLPSPPPPPPLPRLFRAEVGPLPLGRADRGPPPPPPPTESLPVRLRALLRNEASLLTVRGVVMAGLEAEPEVGVGEMDSNAAGAAAVAGGEARVAVSVATRSLGELVRPSAMVAAASFWFLLGEAFLLDRDRLALHRASFRKVGGSNDNPTARGNGHFFCHLLVGGRRCEQTDGRHRPVTMSAKMGRSLRRA